MRVPFGLIAVLVMVSCAYAECAWVLWADHPLGHTDKWTVENSFDSRASCVKSLDALEARLRKQSPKNSPVFRENETQLAQSTPGRTMFFEDFYSCLPDTVDPRAPKGAGR